MKNPNTESPNRRNLIADTKSITGFYYIKTHPKLWYKLAVAFFILWFSMLLIYAVTSNVTNEFYQFIFFVRRPAVLIFNGITLSVLLCHTFNWFSGQRAGLFRTVVTGAVGLTIVILFIVYLVKVIMR